MKMIQQNVEYGKAKGAWYKDESGAEVFIPNNDEELVEAWKQVSLRWQQAKSSGIVGRV